MLSWLVILSHHPRQALPSHRDLSLHPASLCVRCLPRSDRGLPPAQCPIPRRPSLFSSTAYKMLLPQLLCFDNHPFSWGVYPPQRGNHELHNDELQLHCCNPSSYYQERLRPLPASFRQWQTLPQLRLPFPFWSLPSPFHRECRRGCLSPTIPK